jgi:hypothetical protein
MRVSNRRSDHSSKARSDYRSDERGIGRPLLLRRRFARAGARPPQAEQDGAAEAASRERTEQGQADRAHRCEGSTEQNRWPPGFATVPQGRELRTKSSVFHGASSSDRSWSARPSVARAARRELAATAEGFDMRDTRLRAQTKALAKLSWQNPKSD